MKQRRHPYLHVIAGLLSAGTAAAQVMSFDTPEVTVFPEPAEYCFGQTEFHREFSEVGVFLIFKHHLLIPNEHLAEAGDVFVGARFKSRPNELWLLSGNVWRNAANTTIAWPSVYVRYDDHLPPIVPIRLSYMAESIRDLGDGEIWVGYGLRDNHVPTQAAFQESFDEMLSSQRFSLLWEILPGKSPIPGRLHGESGSTRVCLEATQMETTVLGGVGIVTD